MRSETLTEKSVARAARALAGCDQDLAAILKKHGPPPLWRRPPGFSTLVRIILEQQVSLASAASIFARLSSAIDPFTPHKFIEFEEFQLRSLGLTRQKAAYLLCLARAVENGQLDLAALLKMDDEAARLALMQVKGIGDWSADIYLLMAMRRADVWPTGDLALATTLATLKKLPARPRNQQLSQIAERWRPYRAVAARMLWQHYLAERNAK